MYDPTPPQDDELEPIYNPATTDESPVDETILDVEVPFDDIDPIYNPATMEFAEDDET